MKSLEGYSCSNLKWKSEIAELIDALVMPVAVQIDKKVSQLANLVAAGCTRHDEGNVSRSPVQRGIETNIC